MTLAWIGLALLSVLETPTPGPEVRQQYREQAAHAGRTPDDQVKLALWCEARGLQAERLKHLARAVLTDPAHATARGLMGLVADGGRWRRPDEVSARLQADEKRAATQAEYDERRKGMVDSAEAHWRIGVWCAENGLEDEANAHFSNVVRLDPSRDAAWKRLGYTRRDGRWMTDAQVAAAKADGEARKQADRYWTPRLTAWADGLAQDSKRAEAQARLAEVADPHAVRPITRVLAASDRADWQGQAVTLLGQINTQESARVLAILAIRSSHTEVRRSARETLSHRDPREFVGFLLSQVRIPTKYSLGFVADDQGNPHRSLLVEGDKFNLQVNSSFTAADEQMSPPPRLFADNVAFGDQPWGPYGSPSWVDPSGLIAPTPGLQITPNHAGANPNVGGGLKGLLPQGANIPTQPNAASTMVAWYTNQAMLRDQQIAWAASLPPAIGPNWRAEVTSIMENVDLNNSMNPTDNSPIYETLRQTTKQDLPDDREAWRGWYANQLGYTYQSPGQPQNPRATPRMNFAYTIVSCFAAGTPVRTDAGDRAIETLRVGDRVLTQDQANGTLSYQPILRVHHNPPAMALRVRVGDEEILATGFHRFWRVGKGWAMARELKQGDVLRTLGGQATVESVEPGVVQPVFNLDVARDCDFFVGKTAALVHDNSLPDPRALPFDAPREVARRGD